jgi:transcriptional regulator with XRE-family HTH domain
MDSRPALGAFLRARREALPPPVSGRRRTPGWRREEVAAAAGLSVTWLTWAEQGREIALSPHALARLATALRLTPAARAYLFELARAHDPATPPPAPAAPPADLLAWLRGFRGPAYLLDATYTARGWNAPAQTLFSPWYAAGEPNLLRFVFLAPVARTFILDWETRSQNLVAEFRAVTAQDDPAQAALVAQLRAQSPDFARFWTAQDVRARTGGERGFRHPARGELHFTQTTLLPAAHPGFTLVTLLAAETAPSPAPPPGQ